MEGSGFDLGALGKLQDAASEAITQDPLAALPHLLASMTQQVEMFVKAGDGNEQALSALLGVQVFNGLGSLHWMLAALAEDAGRALEARRARQAEAPTEGTEA